MPPVAFGALAVAGFLEGLWGGLGGARFWFDVCSCLVGLESVGVCCQEAAGLQLESSLEGRTCEEGRA